MGHTNTAAPSADCSDPLIGVQHEWKGCLSCTGAFALYHKRVRLHLHWRLATSTVLPACLDLHATFFLETITLAFSAYVQHLLGKLCSSAADRNSSVAEAVPVLPCLVPTTLLLFVCNSKVLHQSMYFCLTIISSQACSHRSCCDLLNASYTPRIQGRAEYPAVRWCLAVPFGSST